MRCALRVRCVCACVCVCVCNAHFGVCCGSAGARAIPVSVPTEWPADRRHDLLAALNAQRCQNNGRLRRGIDELCTAAMGVLTACQRERDVESAQKMMMMARVPLTPFGCYVCCLPTILLSFPATA